MGGVWRVDDHVLIARPGGFALIAPDGELAAEYDDRSFSDEDDLWRWTYEIAGDALIERTSIERRGVPAPHSQHRVLEGLTPVTDATSLGSARAALTRAQHQAQDAIANQRREVDALAAGLVGPLDAQAVPELARARDALCDRIRRYDDEAARALLAALGAVVRLDARGGLARTFAAACLYACFVTDVPALPLAPPEVGLGVAQLAAELTALAHMVEQLGDEQAAVDAHANARAYWNAAKAMQLAAGFAGD